MIPVILQVPNSQRISDPQVKTVINALKFFKPFESRLESWKDVIDKIANNEPSNYGYLSICYYFSILINPNITDEKKKILIKPAFYEDKFLATLKDAPPIIQITILKFSPKEELEKFVNNILKENEKIKVFFDIINEINNSEWTTEEKQSFIDSLFAVLPKEVGNQLIYFSLLKGKAFERDVKEESPSHANFSPKLKERTQSLVTEVELKGAELFKSKNREFTEYKRQYFLEWFYQNGIHDSNSDLIVLKFEKEDWDWLLERTSPGALERIKVQSPLNKMHPTSLVTHTIQWMNNIVKRMKDKELEATDFSGKDNPTVSLFFMHATKEIDRENGLDLFSTEKAKEFADKLTPELLFLYGSSLNKNCFKQIVDELLNSDQQKLYDWLNLIFNSKIAVYTQIREFFDKIGKEKEDLIKKIIFTSTETSLISLQLGFYCSAIDEKKISLCNIILEDLDKGIIILTNWITAFFLENREKLNSYVLEVFPTIFYATLKAVNPAIPIKLYNNLLSKVKNSEDESFLNRLLPIHTPKDNLKIKLDKLKEFCTKTNISFQSRSNFGMEMYSELRKLIKPNCLQIIFDELPETTWPVLFQIFNRQIFDLHNDKKRWVTIATQTLAQLDNNPTIQCDNDINDSQTIAVYRSIYEVAEANNTIVEILIEFIKRPKNFIVILDNFIATNFGSNLAKFRDFFKKALEQSKVSKIDFSVEILKDFFKGPSLQLIPYFSIIFWEYILTPPEIVAVARSLSDEMGVNFINFFLHPSFQKYQVIKSIKNIDLNFGELLFQNCIGSLLLGSQEKLKIFHNICAAYTEAGYDLRKLLTKVQNHFISINSAIEKWYESFNPINFEFNYATVFLLNIFVPQLLEKFVLTKFKEILSKESKYILPYDFNKIMVQLNKIGKKDHFLKLLLEDSEFNKLLCNTFTQDIQFWITSSDFEESIDLLKNLLPNWSKTLADEVNKKITTLKEKKGIKTEYFEFFLLYESLSRLKLLDSWRLNLPFDDSECYAQYLEDQQKKNKKEKLDKKEDK